MIKVDSINKKFADTVAVKDLSFEISQGEIVGLLGPNGAGKTTTMRIMSGFYAPDSGDVYINEVSVLKEPIETQKYLGYLPENNPLYKDMLVSEFLAYTAELKGVPKADLKANLDFVVGAVNIADVYFKPIKELSKGYKQRVGIASALINKPAVLILDEPTEGLDPTQRGEIRNLILDLAKDHTVIISTHVLQEVEALCSRMIIINKGEKVADGLVADISKVVGDKKTLDLVIEGKDIESKLLDLAGVEILEKNPIGSDTLSLKVATPAEFSLQPALSNLIKEKDWVIWKLNEGSRHLEDVFKELTA